jgi:glycosyltransferase involved in cell wall biosynthesis
LNKNLPKVSVIIPVYNIDNYIEECLQSVVKQSLKEIEIIIINDGSTDNSAKIIANFEKKDSRVKCIHLENKGLSIARNKGLSIAKGTFIYFLDGDDYIAVNTLEDCYAEATRWDIDVVFFNAHSFSTHDVKVNSKTYLRQHLEAFTKPINGTLCLEKLLKTDTYKSASVLHFIKREYLYKNDLTFYPELIYEDELFTFMLLLDAPKVMYLNKVLYFRRIRENSITTSQIKEKNIVDYLKIISSLEKHHDQETDLLKKKLLLIRINFMANYATSFFEHIGVGLQQKMKPKLENELNKYWSLKSKIKIRLPKLFKMLKKCYKKSNELFS